MIPKSLQCHAGASDVVVKELEKENPKQREFDLKALVDGRPFMECKLLSLKTLDNITKERLQRKFHM